MVERIFTILYETIEGYIGNDTRTLKHSPNIFSDCRIEESPAWQPFVAQSGVPCMYRAKLRVDDETPRDTFLNMKVGRLL